jgi:Arc/MetJ-type ribon-helix-helix transcriptional regulator
MTLTLTPEQESTLERSVRSGRFASQAEAVNAAISLLTEVSEAEEQREQISKLHERYPTLVDLFADSPFKGLDIEFPRDPSPLREVNF